MSVARVAAWSLLVGLVQLGCGERAADVVVALPAEEGPGQGGSPADGSSGGSISGSGGGGASVSGGSASEAGSGGVPPGPSGLCADCVTSRECGDANDACIQHGDERFCGRDCYEQADCPDGYACVELSNSQLWQCVPNDACVAQTDPAPALAEVRRYVLGRINGERSAVARGPLGASDCLDDLAQQSALDFARTDEPLGKYVKECDPVWPNCECGWWAEAEVTIARYGLDWQTAVESALGASGVGAERFAQAYLSTAVSDVGIGFWLSGDEAWVALSFR